jgi:hypothetical protein
MATVQEDILNAFFAKLLKSGTLDQVAVDALRKLLERGKKLKAEDFVAALAQDPKDGTP